MPKIDMAKAALRKASVYPAEFQQAVRGRERSVLGDVARLSQFGVNLTRLKPGAASALRHWHEREDEFVYILEGEVVLIEDGGETLLRAGEAAGFKAGVADGHCLVNRSSREALYLEIGTRAERERVHYSDVDLELVREETGALTFTHKSGEPYP
ncbi:MAG TPA: cupin domain-containing protein [Xanthobacteraceae bacterium]